MISPSERSLYLRAVDECGLEAQLNQAIEEMAELTVAIRHYCRGRESLKSVAEEMVDVQIMMGQIQSVVELVGVDLQPIRAAKLERLRGRIANEISAP